MTHIEELINKLSGLKAEIEAHEQEIAVQKAIERFELKDFENNLLSGVKIIEYDSANTRFSKHAVVCFRLNGADHKVEFEMDELSRFSSRASDILKDAVWKELGKLFVVGINS